MKPALQQATMVLLILLTTSAAWAAHSDWQEGQFLSNGKPVSEHHCAPSTPGVHPAVILLHGGAGYGPGEFDIENLCSDLAERGYYVESIEYFSQTGGELGPFTGDEVANAPIFMREVESGIDALGKNAAVDSKRIGMMGYSYGATLSLAIGAQEPGKIAAIVDYYGKLPPQLEPRAGNLPPL